MIITKLQGGLGNQMFQYAVALAYSNDEPVLDIEFLQKNNTSTDTFTKRDFELTVFQNARFRVMSTSEKNRLFSLRKRYVLFRKLFGIHISKIQQKENELISIPAKGNIYLDGYFQSEKYFLDKRKLILQAFSFPPLSGNNKKIKDQITGSNAVSIHIRRGDYLKEEVKKYHGVLPEDYYLKAIDRICQIVENPVFFIFSDDKDYAKKLFQNIGNYTVVEGNDGGDSWMDMALMSNCRHHIIANSSFSWWGAWLANQDGAVNIAPKNWFNPAVANFDINNFVPKNWHQL